jgi:hypothetical protein
LDVHPHERDEKEHGDGDTAQPHRDPRPTSCSIIEINVMGNYATQNCCSSNGKDTLKQIANEKTASIRAGSDKSG